MLHGTFGYNRQAQPLSKLLVCHCYYKWKKAIALIMNSTEVQNPRCRVDDKCLCLSYVFDSVLACAKSAHVFQKLSVLLALRTFSLTNNSSSDSKAFFYVSLHSQAPQQQYTVHCMHYGITLWAYLSELLVKDSHKHLKFNGKTTILRAQVT